VQLYGATSVLASGFNNANDLFVDLSQNILVANTGANSIRLITPSGTVSTVSAALNQPYGVTTDTSAFMYVTNTNNNAISKLTYAGVVTTFVSITQPRCIRMDGSGNLYLVSFVGNSQFIIQINPSGGQTNVISGLTNPSSLFVDAAKNIYVPTTNTTTVLTKYSVSGGTWSSSATYTFGSSIRGVAVNAAGYIAVSLGNNTVQIRTPYGIVSTVTGFSTPNGLCFNSSGILYVSDTGNNRVVAITTPP
jgi:sugar lactone lactonase YvrE